LPHDGVVDIKDQPLCRSPQVGEFPGMEQPLLDEDGVEPPLRTVLDEARNRVSGEFDDLGGVARLFQVGEVLEGAKAERGTIAALADEGDSHERFSFPWIPKTFMFLACGVVAESRPCRAGARQSASVPSGKV
jgi:hypothetical protein